MRISLSEREIDILTEDGKSAEESVHRAIRLYGIMCNPDEILAERELNGDTHDA